MRFRTLDEWLNWQEQLHPETIELGLERVQQVWQHLSIASFEMPVITVAGTNGKGSSTALLQAIYLAEGYRVGCYTSPHLFHYSERIAINGVPVTDETIMLAFEAVDKARGNISLTYFEFGTLAALWIFAHAQLDVVLLEVGLGGRLDAVNIIDSDVALITSIGLDHQAWLGDSREKIALEKAGIMRRHRPVVISDPQPPNSLHDAVDSVQASAYFIGTDYQYSAQSAQWTWRYGATTRTGLPVPSLPGQHQLQNAAGVLMVVQLLQDRLAVSMRGVRCGLVAATLKGRFQIETDANNVTCIYDVAHNPSAASALAQTLSEYAGRRRVSAVFSVLKDKDLAGVVAPFCSLIGAWFVAPLQGQRGMPLSDIVSQLTSACPTATINPSASVKQAMLQARAAAADDDIILVFGSFYTVAQASQ